MDGDFTMSDGQEESYPAPESAPSTPYPAWENGDGASMHRRASLPTGGLAPTTPSATPGMADAARGYMTLAQYFQMGKNQPQASEAGSPAPEGDEEDDEEDAEAGDGDDGVEGAEEDQDEEPSQPATSPKPAPSSNPIQPQEDVWTTLPGHHHLPEDDFFAVQTPPTWGAPTNLHAVLPPNTVNDRERNPDQSRSRGRRRGRRSWKWALRGTGHADMFESPKITAEASGTKRRGRGKGAKGANRGRGRGRGRPRGSGASRHLSRGDPGEEFKRLQAKATTAFLDNDLDAALEYALQAVTKNPEVAAAHFLIDQVLTAQGKHEEALQSHWLATMTSRTSEAWTAHGERLLEIAGDEKTEKDYDAAFRCFSEALKLDKYNVEIRSRKVDLFIDMKAYRSAYRECRAYMKLCPGDTDMLWKLAEVRKMADVVKDAKSSREDRCLKTVEAYRAAFHEWRNEQVFGDADMQWAHLDMYVGLLEEAGTTPGECIRELKQIARWFLGRGHEIFWDPMDDDREYDPTPERRIGTTFWMRRMFNLDETRYGNGLPLWLRAKLAYLRASMGPQYREEALSHLDVLILRPGAAEDSPDTFMITAERLSALGWNQEALKLYDAAKDQDHAEATRFFEGMAKCCRRLGRNAEAEDALKSAISADPEKLGARIELARLYADTGRKEDAAQVARAISRLGQAKIQRSEKAFLSQNFLKRTAPAKPRKLAPAGFAEGLDNRSDLVLQHLPGQASGLETGESFPVREEDGNEDADGSDDEDETASLPASAVPDLAAPAKQRKGGRRANKEEIRLLSEQRVRILTSHSVVNELWPCLDAEAGGNEDAVRQWMEHAAVLAKEFTSMKVFYPAVHSDRFAGLLAGKNAETRKVIVEMETLRKQMQAVAFENGDTDELDAMPSIEDQTSGDFHDISFQEWHRILADLALQHARFSEQEKCNRILDALTRGNVFRHDFTLYNTTLALSIYCAIVFNDRELFMETSRQYLYQSDYRSGMAYQMYAASASIGHGDSPFDLEGSKMQQWTQRLVKAQDLLVMDPEMRERWEWGVAELQGKEPRHKRLGRVDDGLIPGLLTTYAHIVSSRRRVHSSSSLAYLFRALALKPDDVVVNLSIATNCILDALRRSDPEGAGLDRQRTIQQGLSYFYRYYNARVATGRKCYMQEAEYNAARIWDILGWTHLSARGYEKVLKLSPQVHEEAKQAGEEVEDLAVEAAFALQKIFVAAENEEAARAIGEEWLVV